jgi:hypothetical protein
MISIGHSLGMSQINQEVLKKASQEIMARMG